MKTDSMPKPASSKLMSSIRIHLLSLLPEFDPDKLREKEVETINMVKLNFEFKNHHLKF